VFRLGKYAVKWHLFRLGKYAAGLGLIKTMITNSLGILGARANAECLEDRLGIMVGDGKAAFGRRRSADAANREAYKSTAGTTAQVTAATQVAGRAPKRRCGGCRGAAVRLEPQSPYRRR